MQEEQNKFSKEIQEDLAKFSEKYNINIGFLLFEERDKDMKSIINNRVIIFPAFAEEKFSICRLAKFFLKCISDSKTFQKIFDHSSQHSIMDILEETMKSKTRAKRAD